MAEYEIDNILVSFAGSYINIGPAVVMIDGSEVAHVEIDELPDECADIEEEIIEEIKNLGTGPIKTENELVLSIGT